MTEDILRDVRAAGGLKNAIMGPVELDRAAAAVTVRLVTDIPYSEDDYNAAYAAVRKYVPAEFSLGLEISKLTPDCAMVRKKIYCFIREKYPALAAVAAEDDISVERTDGGFRFTIAVLGDRARGEALVRAAEAELKKCFCGNFYGSVSSGALSAESIVVEREEEEEKFEAPARTFPVCNFSPIESADAPRRAFYIADFNFVSDNAVVCGKITDVTERTYIRSNGEQRPYYSITLNDGTGSLTLTCFVRKKNEEKIKALKEEDSIVCNLRSEVRGGGLRYTSTYINYGSPPENFVPEKRKSRPVPKAYHTVKPQPFVDFTQTDFFTDTALPECFKGTSFVVFDLETTGLTTVPVAGEIDEIIEIGAYKVIDGEIKEKFSTFVKPDRTKKLEQRIVDLTGITDAMLASAPRCGDVLPDFVKFCDGSVLVGHNAVQFDYKFISFYCSELGFNNDHKVIDTLSLSQKLLHLSNYKLNTVAEKFGIGFNHHRAEDDALATAKIFIELIKIKKSLP